MRRHTTRLTGFTLMEMMIVVSLMSILAGLLISTAGSNVYDQLQSTAQFVAGDFSYARGLAVMNNSTYRVTFDVTNDKYTLKYSGANPSLVNLPASPFRAPGDPADQQITVFANLPRVNAPVRIYSMYTQGSPLKFVTDVEFGPLGGTTRSQDTVVWLAAGSGSATRYISVRVSAVTGLCWIENYQAQAPASG